MSHAGHEVPAAHDLTEHKGLDEGALTFFGTLMIGLASVAPAYSLGGHAGLCRDRGRHAGPCGGGARLHPDAAHRLRLPGAEQGHPGLRHHVHLGDQGVRTADRLVQRLGADARRDHRAGEPGPGRGSVHLPAHRRRLTRGQHVLGDGAGGRVHRSHGLGFLPRHRDRPLAAERARRHPVPRSRRPRRGRPDRGRGSEPAGHCNPDRGAPGSIHWASSPRTVAGSLR